MMRSIARRDLLLAAPLAAAGRGSVRLHASTYGMQPYEPDRAIAVARQTGYDGLELCLMEGWPTHPSKLDAAARRRIRESRFPVPTLIENFNTLVADAAHAKTLDRIRAAAQLAHDLAPKRPAILQSVLGGRPNEWEQVKDKMAARLAEWARVAHESRIPLAVKSHVSSASNSPERLLWLLERANTPGLSAIYDYSHFQLQGMALKSTLESLLPKTSFLTVKDGRMVNGAVQFLLPGEGDTDYKTYFDLLKQRRFEGWMLVEVSRGVQTLPGYDPAEAARKSYAHLAPLLRSAGLRK